MAIPLMPWIELHATTSAEFANELGDQLVEFGAAAVTFQDAGDEPIYEPTPGSTPHLWHKTIVIGLFGVDEPLEPVIQFLEAQQALGSISQFHRNPVADEDWERRCLDSFKPICCGKQLWICPSWHTPPDPSAVNVILDPGLAFGTGTHPTTALCLAWLDENILSDPLVVDYGCGSGILAIAALKLGAQKAIAIDNDPQALEATRTNAERNQVNTLLISQLPEEPLAGCADVLIANILAQPLIELAPRFAALTRPGSKLVLSGILTDQVKKVMAAYQAWFIMHPPAYQAQWVRLTGIRK